MPEDFIPQIKPDGFVPPQIKLNTTEDVAPDVVENADSKTMEEQIKSEKRNSGKMKKFIISFFGILAIFIVLIVIFIVLPGISLYRGSLSLMAQAKTAKASIDSQDISVVKSELDKFEKELISFQKSFKVLSWTKVIPVVGNYWKDGDAGIKAGLYGLETADLIIETAEPYADIIGFAGANSKQSTSGEDTANDRIEFIVQTIESVLPKMDQISEKASLAKAELDKIDPARYPENFRGKEVRSKLIKAIEMADEGTEMLAKSKPLMEVAPYLLGIDAPRTYLLLFQNDKELRPTGGFITAYSIMQVDKGKVHPVSSSDIYNLDNKYKPAVEAPEALRNYLKGPYTLSKYYRLRDMNWNPDFKESMDLFLSEAKTAGIDDIDGIVAVDTQVLVNLLDVLGEIGVPGFGNFSTKIDSRCNCPNVIYELESFADVEGPIVWSENEPGKIVFAPANYDNRKKIVGPLMNSVLSNALGQPKNKLPGLFNAGWKSVMEKHVLLYMLDDKAQKGVEKFNLAGRVRSTDGDYLQISDANLGGRKSNLYVTQEVQQEVKVNKDNIEKTLTLTYKNPQAHDGWLNSVLPNWTRIYVPKGSELISVEGFDDKAAPYEEFGKTVFAGGFQLRPEGVKQITVRYKVPIKFKGQYKLMIQKQPGLDAPLYTIKVGKNKEELFLKGDKEFKFGI
jgi:hypothetical protein